MFTSRFQELMTRGYSLANKWYFKEWIQSEFDQWIEECHSLLSSCEPEPYFPWFPESTHIEEIVMLLAETRSKISKGQVQYTGLF
jgi:hypothetical protein